MFTHEEDAGVHRHIQRRGSCPGAQQNERVHIYLRGNVNHNGDLSIGANRCIHTQRMVQLPEVHSRAVRPTERSLRARDPDTKSRGLEQMLDGCVTWSLRACHYDTLRRAHHSFLTRCIGWRKNNRTDHPISYLDTLIKTGSKSIEAIIRMMRRILFTGFVAHMEDTRLPKYVRGAGCVGSQKKEWMRCFLNDLRPFGISTPTSGRLQPPRTKKNGARRRSKGRKVFGCTSRTVSYAWELISVSMCYSQGYCTHASLRVCIRERA